jgi:hypothetical protein
MVANGNACLARERLPKDIKFLYHKFDCLVSCVTVYKTS